MEIKKFAFIVENEAFMQMTIGPSEYYDMFVAGLKSNPIIVDITEMNIPEGPITGWIWDGETLKAPE